MCRRTFTTSPTTFSSLESERPWAVPVSASRVRSSTTHERRSSPPASSSNVIPNSCRRHPVVSVRCRLHHFLHQCMRGRTPGGTISDVNRRSFLKNTVGATLLFPGFIGEGRSEQRDTVVRTTYGSVRGSQRGDITVFLGIPYGASTHSRRFQPPLPPAPWQGVRDALTWGDRAPQLLGRTGMTAHAQSPPSAELAQTYHLPPDEGADQRRLPAPQCLDAVSSSQRT